MVALNSLLTNIICTVWCCESLFIFTADGDQLLYTFTVPVSCKKTPNAQYVHVTFENNLKQRTSARLDIPVIYGTYFV